MNSRAVEFTLRLFYKQQLNMVKWLDCQMAWSNGLINIFVVVFHVDHKNQHHTKCIQQSLPFKHHAFE